MSELIRQILKTTTYRPLDVEAVLDEGKKSWCRFDPRIGYCPRTIELKDGQDFCHTTYTYEPAGHRKMLNYTDRTCRINTYGDSFTMSQQVSDDESWQERLAAHLGEPVRNFGCGGHSVCTAHIRAMLMEEGPLAAEYLVLTIYDNDHVRNLDASRWIRTQWNEKDRPRDRAWPLHGLPWPHLRWDLAQGKFVERPAVAQSAADLRRLTDPEHFYNTFHDDQIVRLFVLQKGGEARFDDLEQTAEALRIKVDFRNPSTRPAEALRFHLAYGFKSTEYLLESRLLPWCEKNKRHLLVPLTYCESEIVNFLKGGERFDTAFLDFLRKKNIRWVDGLQLHKDDFADFGCTPEKYVSRLFIKPTAAAVFGHYNAMGNAFIAYAMKNAIVDWLNPKPPAYRG